MVKESQLLSKDLEVILQLTDGIELEDKYEIFLDPNPDAGQKSRAELEFINKKIFDLV